MAKINPLVSQPVPLSTGTKTTSSLSLKFGLQSGGTRTLSLSYPREDLTEELIVSSMAQIVENGDAFEDRPIEALKAVLTKTEKETFLDNE